MLIKNKNKQIKQEYNLLLNDCYRYELAAWHEMVDKILNGDNTQYTINEYDRKVEDILHLL